MCSVVTTFVIVICWAGEVAMSPSDDGTMMRAVQASTGAATINRKKGDSMRAQPKTHMCVREDETQLH